MQPDDLIPTLDISEFTTGTDSASLKIAKTVDDACRNIGFLIIEGHGVPGNVVENVSDSAKRFFDLPESIKTQYQESDDIFFGYKALKHASLAYSLDDAHAKPDLREQFGTPRPDSGELNDPYFMSEKAREFLFEVKWPREIEGFRKAWIDYYDEMVRLGEKIMRIFAVALDMPVDYFDAMIDRHVSNMAVYNYPEQNERPEEGQLRGGAHTDFGSLTIVHADWNAPGGLQVFTKDKEWLDVPAKPGTFVINIGDMMERWTNDQWVSTLHRVGNPPDDDAAPNRRQSIIFFHVPNHDTVVECIPSCIDEQHPCKYPSITVGDHQLMKMGKMFSMDE